MKVKITHTLDIDPESWEMNYGVSGTDAIRKDVREHAFHMLNEHYGSLGLGVLVAQLPQHADDW